MNASKISVVIPFYNVEKYIEKCIRSVQKQTFKDFECILVDDESPDNSKAIAEKYIKGDDRFRIISQKNKGLGGARNTGIEDANGEYICFLDSDDWWDDNFLEVMFNTIEREKADIVCCRYRRVDEQGNVQKEDKFINGIFENKEDILKVLLERHITWDKIYRLRLFEKVRFPEKMLHEDFATTYKLAEFCSKVLFINNVLINYLQRETSIMGSRGERSWEDNWKISDEIVRVIPEKILFKFYVSFVGGRMEQATKMGKKFDEIKEMMCTRILNIENLKKYKNEISLSKYIFLRLFLKSAKISNLVYKIIYVYK